MSISHDPLLARLRTIVGRRHVLTEEGATRRFRDGFRCGTGPAVAVVLPATLVEQWRVVQACVDANVSLIMQAANTGLTGGSTPDGDDYPGGVVIVSTSRMGGIHLIDDGRQAVCLPGSTLYDLERVLAPIGREPHSVIGSSCIGASVLGGVCNNSGGSLVQRGPSYTELALFARARQDGTLELVNHLGIRLGHDPEEILARLERGDFTADDIEFDTGRRASDQTYGDHVRDIDADSPARFNADPRCLFEAAGSAGKLILFAVRLDTFQSEPDSATFYIGTNDPAELTEIRRHILGNFATLPVAGEYLHRTIFDIAEVYGKDTFLAIQRLGTGRLPAMFALKARVDAMASRLGWKGAPPSDRAMQWLSRLFPRHLPKRMYVYRDHYEHHLMLKMAGGGIAEARAYLKTIFPSAQGDFFECTKDEGAKAFLHRFAAAGAAVRYRAVHGKDVEDIVALDIALPRNTRDWVEELPADIDDQIIHKLYYGHFFCQVFHQDYIVKKGVDPIALEHRMWKLLDRRNAQYPAEHNVGHLYKANDTLADFYRSIDPSNRFNPGIGQTSKQRFWGEREHPATPADPG